MQDLNMSWFYFLNAGENLSGWPLHLAIFAAKYLICAIPLWLIVCWIGRPSTRGALLSAVMAVVLALCINKVIGIVWFHPRPFMIPVGHTYLSHAADSSFPSDHTTIIWAVGLSFLLSRGLRISGCVLLALALCVGWARVFVGVHFPMDILGGIAVGSLAVAIVKPADTWINQKILPWFETIHRKIFLR